MRVVSIAAARCRPRPVVLLIRGRRWHVSAPRPARALAGAARALGLRPRLERMTGAGRRAARSLCWVIHVPFRWAAAAIAAASAAMAGLGAAMVFAPGVGFGLLASGLLAAACWAAMA